MAFRGEASAVRVSDAQIASHEPAVSTDPRVVSPDDAFRIRLAVGIMTAVAAIDCVLYVSRLF